MPPDIKAPESIKIAIFHIRYHLSPEWAKDYKGIALRQVELPEF
jgi:hypothetical protein